MNPIASVIVPNFNHARFLRKRITSILEQSYQDFELIILDDCSTDSSIKVLDAYKSHPKVTHVVINRKNSGSPFSQWKKGIDLAKGQYIWIAESDDYADPCFLEKTVGILDSQKEVTLVYSQSYIVDESSNIVRENYSWTCDLGKGRWDKDYINCGREEAKEYFIRKNIVPNASAVLFRKDAIPENITWPLKMKMLGDWFFWIQLIQTNKLAYLSECLNYFRVTGQSTRMHHSFSKKKARLKEELMVLFKNYQVNSVPTVITYTQYKRLLREIYYLHVLHRKLFSFVIFLFTPVNLRFIYLIKNEFSHSFSFR